MRDIEELIREAKRSVAIHEAGHLTVARAIGGNGQTNIYPVPTSDVMSQATWVGQFIPASVESRCPLVGVAGVVAECWVEAPDADAFWVAESIDFGPYVPSNSDLKLIHGAVYEERWPETSQYLVSSALGLLREHKTFFDWAVAELVKKLSISNRDARYHFEQLLVEKRKQWEQSTTRL